MYSALYAADCQGKRLLILAITIAEGNPDVKNLSYLPPRTYKRAISLALGRHNCALCPVFASPVMTEVFPKWQNLVWKSGRVPGTTNLLPVRPPRTKWGASPKLCS